METHEKNYVNMGKRKWEAPTWLLCYMDTVEKSNLFLSVSKLFRCLFAFSSVTPTFVRSIGSLLFLYMCRVFVSWLERYSKPRKKNPFNACWLWSLSLCWHGRKYIQKMKFTGFENLVWPKEKKCAPSESHRTSYYKHQWFLISQSKAHRHSTHTTHLRRGKEREKILPTTKRRRYTLLDG